eukprot:UN05931
MKWKLVGTQNNNDHKLNVLWKEIESKGDDYKEFDEKKNENEWTNQEIKLNSLQNINESQINVRFNSDKNVTTFALKMRYFNDKKWSNYSNIMTVKAECSFFRRSGLHSLLIKGIKLKNMFVNNVLPETLKNKQFSLLIRGSEHGFDYNTFIQRCANKGASLVIVSTNEYDRIFGGYTSISWQGTGGYKTDANAFLYFMSEKENKGQR